nr:MAG TPA: hypothetical protein [Caudoviricetes sp.]
MTKTNNEIVAEIEALVHDAESMKNCYFWNSPSTASARRSYEKKLTHEEISWMDGTDTYTAEFVVTCSCKNIYAQGRYTKNGIRTTLTTIKNSLKRLQNS